MFFNSEPLTKTSSDFLFEFRGVCGNSTSDPGSCHEPSLCSWLDSDVESCRSKVSDATLFFRLPRTVVAVRDMNFERAGDRKVIENLTSGAFGPVGTQLGDNRFTEYWVRGSLVSL